MQSTMATADPGRVVRGWLAALLCVPGIALAQQSVTVLRQDQQPVPLTANAPRTQPCAGVAVLSPGAGGSEQGLAALGSAMAALGYQAVVVGHQESGREALRRQVQRLGLREGLAALTTAPDAYRGRLMDIDAARHWAQSHCPTGRAVLIGHSMGAATAMIAAGARNKVGARATQPFDAYIALSPQGPGAIFPDDAWADIRQPVLLLTGTRDTELGGAPWQHRTVPFERMPAGCKWLGVIDGATHMQLGGGDLSRTTDLLTVQAVTGFLDSLARGDCQAPAMPAGITIRTR
jgi:predicted dienelactone hydrolase